MRHGNTPTVETGNHREPVEGSELIPAEYGGRENPETSAALPPGVEGHPVVSGRRNTAPPDGPEHLHGAHYDGDAVEFVPSLKGCVGCLGEAARLKNISWPPASDAEQILAAVAAKADEVASEGEPTS